MRSSLSSIARRITRQQRSNLLQRRGYAADPHGEVKVNAWEAPTEVAKWKEEHVVFAVLGGWGITITTALKVFGGKKEEKPAAE
eukprot:scaffold4.g5036.t1